MAVHPYGVLAARVIDGWRESRLHTPHYQIHCLAAGVHFRVAVNIRSETRPPDLLFLVDPDFPHPLTGALRDLPPGFTALPSRPGGGALDYVRGRLFDPAAMRVLPPDQPGPNNDLSDQLDAHVTRAIAEDGTLYAFGMRWGPETHSPDEVFHFRPGNGLHNVHMNQGNGPGHAHEDGPWQDGGLILHWPAPGRWVGIFLAFQSQTWQTDARTGRAMRGAPRVG